MEVNIRELLEGLEDSSVPMDDANVVSAKRIKELTKMKIEPRNCKSYSGTSRRIITFALAAALIMSMGAVVYAVGEIYEYRKIEDSPELIEQSEQGMEDIRCFILGDHELTPVPEALYVDNDVGQSGVTKFTYTVDGTNTKVYIDYYDTGEIYYLDASELYPFDYSPYEFSHDYLEAKFPDKEALRIQLIEMVPGIVDDLHEDGWIKHSSKDIFKADILPEQTIWIDHCEVRCLMNDGSSYEFWLDPETFELKAFLHFNSEDTPKMRDGFYVALKEDRLEEWWQELQSRPTLG